MIADRSSSLRRAQPAISARVRRQPRQKPLRPSTAQTFTQGVAIGRGGRRPEVGVSMREAEVMVRNVAVAGSARKGVSIQGACDPFTVKRR